MAANIIEGTCCGDCAVCTFIGENDPIPCALRILMKKVKGIESKVEMIEGCTSSIYSIESKTKSDAVFVSDEN